MHRLAGIMVAGLLAVGVAAPASAGTLPFHGSLVIQISALDPIMITGTGSALLNGSSGGGVLHSMQISSGVFNGGVSLSVTDPAASPIEGLSATALNGGGLFQGAPFGGFLALQGNATVCLFSSDCNGGPGTALVVPFTDLGQGVGLGGSVTAMGGGIQITVEGAPWTLGTAVAEIGAIGGPFTSLTAMGFVHGPASGGLSSAAAPSGVVSLVTPIQILTNIGPSGALPAFAIMTVHFTPEPGTLLLVGSGVVALAAFGRKRAHR